MELGDRGVSSSLIAEVIESSEADWFDLATVIRHKKFGASLPADFAARAKQMRFLQYRGFEQAHIQAAVSGRGDDQT